VYLLEKIPMAAIFVGSQEKKEKEINNILFLFVMSEP